MCMLRIDYKRGNAKKILIEVAVDQNEQNYKAF